MKLEKKNLIVERPYKSVYKTEEGVVKIFVTNCVMVILIQVT